MWIFVVLLVWQYLHNIGCQNDNSMFGFVKVTYKLLLLSFFHTWCVIIDIKIQSVEQKIIWLSVLTINTLPIKSYNVNLTLI